MPKFDTSEACRKKVKKVFKEFTDLDDYKEKINDLFLTLDKFNRNSQDVRVSLDMDQGDVNKVVTNGKVSTDPTGEFFHALAHIICNGQESNFVYNKSGDAVNKWESAGTYECSWQYENILLRAYTVREYKQAAWYLEIKNITNDALLDSIYSVLQSMHHRLNAVEASVTASPPRLG